MSTTLPPRRLLIRGVNWLGDAVMSTPALLRLREALPQTHLALLTPEKLAGLWPGHPALDEVILIGAREGAVSLGRRLRALDFDTALLLPNSPRSALECWLARIPRRIGYGTALRRALLTEVVPPRAGAVLMRKRTLAEIRQLVAKPPASFPPVPPQSHHLHHYLHLAGALGANPAPVAPQVAVNDLELAAVREKFGLPGGRLIGVNAGAEYGPAKRWPVAKFIAVAKELQTRRPHCHLVLFGGPDETRLSAQLGAALGAAAGRAVTNLAGRTTLRELAAALRACRVVLTNDTGPMHLAAAVGTRVVAIFGSTSPELTGPGLPGEPRPGLLRGPAPCAPCFRRECPIDYRCLHNLAVEPVVAAVLRAAE